MSTSEIPMIHTVITAAGECKRIEDLTSEEAIDAVRMLGRELLVAHKMSIATHKMYDLIGRAREARHERESTSFIAAANEGKSRTSAQEHAMTILTDEMVEKKDGDKERRLTVTDTAEIERIVARWREHAKNAATWQDPGQVDFHPTNVLAILTTLEEARNRVERLTAGVPKCGYCNGTGLTAKGGDCGGCSGSGVPAIYRVSDTWLRGRLKEAEAALEEARRQRDEAIKEQHHSEDITLRHINGSAAMRTRYENELISFRAERDAYRRAYGCLSCGENHGPETICPPHEVRTTGLAWYDTTMRQAVARATKAEAERDAAIAERDEARAQWQQKSSSLDAEIRAHIKTYASLTAAEATRDRLSALLKLADDFIVQVPAFSESLHGRIFLPGGGLAANDVNEKEFLRAARSLRADIDAEMERIKKGNTDGH